MIHQEEDQRIASDTSEMRFGEEALAWVSECADRVDRDRFALAVAIGKAHEQGLTLRAIAEAARVSHEQVRRIVRADSLEN